MGRDKKITYKTLEKIILFSTLDFNYQWINLFNEGISGILTEQGEAWYYKSNLGDTDEDGEVAFSVAKAVIPKPSLT